MVLPLPNSAFWDKLQNDDINIAETIDLFTPGANYFWTTQNDEAQMANSSGAVTIYQPFPGQPTQAPKKGTDLVISTVRFVMANSGGAFDNLILGKELSRSTLVLRRYFVDTPGLGQIEIMRGKIGDFTWTRNEISGQVRDSWDSATQKFPYYNFQDNCIWKFGGVGCGFDTSSVTITLSIDVTSSTQLKVFCVSGSLTQSFSNGHFTFGKLTASFGVNSGQARTIRVHSGDVLEMSHQFGGAVNSLGATLFPGCRKRRITDCLSKYDNVHNFHGHEWIPIQEEAF